MGKCFLILENNTITCSHDLHLGRLSAFKDLDACMIFFPIFIVRTYKIDGFRQICRNQPISPTFPFPYYHQQQDYPSPHLPTTSPPDPTCAIRPTTPHSTMPLPLLMLNTKIIHTWKKHRCTYLFISSFRC